MPAPIPQGTTEPPMAHELRESLYYSEFLQAASMLKTSFSASLQLHDVLSSTISHGW